MTMTNSTTGNEHGFNLTYLHRFNILNEEEKLREPSGLALAHGNDALWTVSDDTNKIFKMSLDGVLLKDQSFKIKDSELEGIALDPSGEFLVTVKESKNEIIKIRIDTRQRADKKKLKDMVGYESVKHHFKKKKKSNKGLEGITWHTKKGTIFVIKEGKPGLLLEVSQDLKTILNHQLLNGENGFQDSELKSKKIDFSGICYDPSRDRFWIASHKAKRVFLYNWNKNEVTQSFRLGYEKNGEFQRINQAEGIAVDPDKNRLYIVCDVDKLLYVFDIDTPGLDS